MNLEGKLDVNLGGKTRNLVTTVTALIRGLKIPSAWTLRLTIIERHWLWQDSSSWALPLPFQ